MHDCEAEAKSTTSTVGFKCSRSSEVSDEVDLVLLRKESR